MLVKPIDKPEPPQPKVLNSLAGPKLAFLVAVLVMGFIIVSQRSSFEVKKPVAQQEKASSSKTPDPIFKPEQFVNTADLDKTKDSLLTASKEKGKELSGVVFGEATKQLMPIASKGAEMAEDYVYKNTIEEVIKRLILVLPERRQRVLEDWLKKSQ